MPEITKLDALRWLEMQRDAVNTEIVYAPQSEKKQYHDHLKIINWLADAARIHGGEMTAVEYLEAKSAMCDSEWNAASCNRCDLNDPQMDRGCAYFETDHPLRAVEVVKRWKEEQDELRH